MNAEPDNLEGAFLVYLQTELHTPGLTYHSPMLKIEGGYETSIYKFQLTGIDGKWSKPLILRLYPAYFGSNNAVWESVVQNVLNKQGYPTARAHIICTNCAVLGGAFFVMDFLPGVPMLDAVSNSIPMNLATAHAALHNLDPKTLMKSLVDAGIKEDRLVFDYEFHWLKDKMKKYPWVRQVGDWLIKNVPAQPQQLVVCHGDFHPLNILVDGEEVSGVLDWPGLKIADPALDIATTLVLLSIPYQILGPVLRPDIDLEIINSLAQEYLTTYQSLRSLDSTRLRYYQTRRCLHALIQGVEGQESWRQTEIVDRLKGYIQEETGIHVQIKQG